MTWLAKLWARWFCKYLNRRWIGRCWHPEVFRFKPFKLYCPGYKCKGCPLPRKGGKNG